MSLEQTLITTQLFHQKMHALLKILIKVYIKIRWLLHVSVNDHHQGACNWAWL